MRIRFRKPAAGSKRCGADLWNVQPGAALSILTFDRARAGSKTVSRRRRVKTGFRRSCPKGKKCIGSALPRLRPLRCLACARLARRRGRTPTITACWAGSGAIPAIARLPRSARAWLRPRKPASAASSIRDTPSQAGRAIIIVETAAARCHNCADGPGHDLVSGNPLSRFCGLGCVAMMRTVWLGLVCLIGLGAMASLRIATSTPANSDVSPAAATSGASLPQAPLGKADKLLVSYTEEASEDVPEKKLVTSIAIVPPKAAAQLSEKTAEIVSRHWHEGFAGMTGRPARHRQEASRTRQRD